MSVDAGDISIPSGLTVITGGARSGKSTLAQRIGESWRGEVCFVATATAGDDDMAERIARHRSERPDSWITIESPIEVVSDVRTVSSGSLMIIDCLTMWVSNLVLQGFQIDKVEVAASNLGQFINQRESPTVVVTNEVGLGIVPDNDLARRYRDTLGRVNQLISQEAQLTLFASMGQVIKLKNIEDLL